MKTPKVFISIAYVIRRSLSEKIKASPIFLTVAAVVAVATNVFSGEAAQVGKTVAPKPQIPKTTDAVATMSETGATVADDFAILTIGAWGGDNFLEGRMDALVRMISWEDGALMFDGRASYADEGEEEINLGAVLRQKCLPYGGVLGLNAFYDSRWVDDAHFNQAGVGGEILTKWVDFRANYYLPEREQEYLGSHEEKSIVGTRDYTVFDQYAVANQLRESWKRIRQDIIANQKYDMYSVPLKGFDAEFGVRVPTWSDDFQVRAFLGYYDFEPHGSKGLDVLGGMDDVSGVKGRIELRAWNRLFFDAELFENDKLYGSDYLVSARVRIPLGSDSFRDKTPEDRMDEMVVRDPRIQLRSAADISVYQSENRTTIGKGDNLILNNVIFVHADNVDDLFENGSAEHPYNKIQEGVDKSFEISYPNVYVFGARNTYSDRVNIFHGVNLYGEGRMLGHAFPGSGKAPVVQVVANSRQLRRSNTLSGAFNIYPEQNAKPVLIQGFEFSGAKLDEESSFAGIWALNHPALTVKNNKFNDIPVGIVAKASNGDANLIAKNNTFDNVVIGGIGLADKCGSLVATFNNNTVNNAFAGIIGLSLGNKRGEAELNLTAHKNKVSESPGSIGGRLEMSSLLRNLGVKSATPRRERSIYGPFEFLPSIGIGAIALSLEERAKSIVKADITKNYVSGPLVGIAGIVYSSEGAAKASLGFTAYENTVDRGSPGALNSFLSNYGDSLLSFINDVDSQNKIETFMKDRFSPGLDESLAGIVLATYGRRAEANKSVIEKNIVGNSLLGIGAAASFESEINELEISGNLIDESLAGIAVTGFDGSLIEKTNIIDNKVKDGLLGIGLIGFSGGYSDSVKISKTKIARNKITDTTLGIVSGAIAPETNLDKGSIGGFSFSPRVTVSKTKIVDNKVKDGLLGIGLIGYSDGYFDSVEISETKIARNKITDTTLGIVSGAIAPETDLDRGSIRNAFFSPRVTVSKTKIVNNKVKNGLLGIGLIGYSGGDPNSVEISKTKIARNKITDTMLGVVSGAIAPKEKLYKVAKKTPMISNSVIVSDTRIIKNTIKGGGLNDSLFTGKSININNLLGSLNSLVDNIATVDDDIGLSGIATLSIGNTSLVGLSVEGNDVSSEIVGVLSLLKGSDFGYSDTKYKKEYYADNILSLSENTIDNSWIGILGIFDNVYAPTIEVKKNKITGGMNDSIGSYVSNMLLGEESPSFESLPGIAGICLIANDSLLDVIDVSKNKVNDNISGISLVLDETSVYGVVKAKNNKLKRNAIGLIGIVQDNSTVDRFNIKNNTIKDSAIGILTYAIDSRVSGMGGFRIIGNKLDGSGDHSGLALSLLQLVGHISDNGSVLSEDLKYLMPYELFGLEEMRPGDGRDMFGTKLYRALKNFSNNEITDMLDFQTNKGIAGMVMYYGSVENDGLYFIKEDENTFSEFRNRIIVTTNIGEPSDLKGNLNVPNLGRRYEKNCWLINKNVSPYLSFKNHVFRHR